MLRSLDLKPKPPNMEETVRVRPLGKYVVEGAIIALLELSLVQLQERSCNQKIPPIS